MLLNTLVISQYLTQHDRIIVRSQETHVGVRLHQLVNLLFCFHEHKTSGILKKRNELLNISFDYSKSSIIFGRHGEVSKDPILYYFQGHSIEAVGSFTSLGSVTEYDSSVKDVQLRIEKTSGKFRKLHSSQPKD